MFTGLIRTQGTIRRIDVRGDTVMEIEADAPLPLSLGASVACHGMCLTVMGFVDAEPLAARVEGTRPPLDHTIFTTSLSAETLCCTNAGSWKVGTRINLEPSLAVGDAMGGHFVSGHVDGLARVVRIEPSGDSQVWEFDVPAHLAKFIAPKGSITLDGVSLTVNTVVANRFTVNIIPHTAANTGFATLAAGDSVNLEIDMLARYVARLAEAAA